MCQLGGTFRTCVTLSQIKYTSLGTGARCLDLTQPNPPLSPGKLYGSQGKPARACGETHKTLQLRGEWVEPPLAWCPPNYVLWVNLGNGGLSPPTKRPSTLRTVCPVRLLLIRGVNFPNLDKNATELTRVL